MRARATERAVARWASRAAVHTPPPSVTSGKHRAVHTPPIPVAPQSLHHPVSVPTGAASARVPPPSAAASHSGLPLGASSQMKCPIGIALSTEESLQTWPARHGEVAHSSTSAMQSRPSQPRAQVHRYVFMSIVTSFVDESLHVPPCWHGCEAHSSISSSHDDPVFQTHF